jgi:hypothetical protein
VGATAGALVQPLEQPSSTPWRQLHDESRHAERRDAGERPDADRAPEQRRQLVREPELSERECNVVWTKDVPALLEGDLENGIDYNGNGVRDETGLAFVKNGKSITVYLTLRRTMRDGQVLTKTSVKRSLAETDDMRTRYSNSPERGVGDRFPRCSWS